MTGISLVLFLSKSISPIVSASDMYMLRVSNLFWFSIIIISVLANSSKSAFPISLFILLGEKKISVLIIVIMENVSAPALIPMAISAGISSIGVLVFLSCFPA